MCEQCLTWPVSFGQPLEGFTLMRARRQGNDWRKGYWGLVECNDPTFMWKSTPIPLSEDDMPYGYPDEFATALICDPNSGYRLVAACMEKGYNQTTSLYSWLFDYLGRWLLTAPMTDEGDAFPNRESFAPVDLTIGREIHNIETQADS